MKIRLLGFLSLALTVCFASAVQAQDEQPGRGRGQRGQRGGFGGFGGFGRGPGGFQQGGALDLMGLLRMEEVRKEVGMDEEIWNAIPEEAKQIDFRAMFQASEDERAKMMEEANETAQSTLDEVLEPEKQKRLMGLLAQRDGYRAVNNDLIAQEIGLDDAGKEKVRDAMAKIGEEMREAFGRGRGRGGEEGGRGGFNPEEMRARMEEMQQKMNDGIAAALTAEQKQKFEDLKGEKFEFPEFQGFGGRGGPGGFGGRGGPGGPGGRGGRPGGGNRPSGNDNGN